MASTPESLPAASYHATTRERITIGDDCTLGMGAVLLKSIGAGETWYGNPARKR